MNLTSHTSIQIRNLEEINDQNVPISLQKYIMPVMENSKLAIYESFEEQIFH